MDYNQFYSIIIKLFSEKLNYDLSDKQIEKFFNYMNYLIAENEKINLTAIIEPVDIIYKHFFDSCQIIKFNNVSFDNKKILDLGSGAGFPSVPIAILFESCSFVMIDSVNKKVSFINSLKEVLGLNNIHAVHGRIEDLAHMPEYKDKFDYCFSRALSSISVFLEYSASFLQIYGKSFIYKMADSLKELELSKNAQKILYMNYTDSFLYNLYFNEPDRIIYSFSKISLTPNRYPRKAGIPSKQPL